MSREKTRLFCPGTSDLNGTGKGLIVTNCTIIVLIIRDSVQHCAVWSILDRVQVDVMPLAIIFLWFIVSFLGVKKVTLILQRPVQYHPRMSSITNCKGQCSIIPLCQVLQNTAASAVSSPYVQYYKLQRPVQYHLLMSSITNYRGQCSIIPLCQVLQTPAAVAISSPCVKYFKTLLLSVAVFISHYSTVIRNITFSPSV